MWVRGVGLIMFVLVMGCGPSYQMEKTEVRTEKARIHQIVYMPDTRKTEIAPGWSFGEGGGLTLTAIETGHEAIYGVVLKCERHNKVFTLLGKQFYDAVIASDAKDVQLDYVETYKIYEDGRRELIDVETLRIRVH